MFNPGKRVATRSYIAIEKEIDLLRLQLESQLRGGAHYLHRVKKEIESDRKKLQPAMLIAHRQLAQAKKDLEVASEHNSFIPTVIILVIAFFIGIFF